MSADSWTSCFACEGTQEYDAEGVDKNFREDYEFYGAETGVVTVVYSGRCVECGYGVSFEDQVPIPALSKGGEKWRT